MALLAKKFNKFFKRKFSRKIEIIKKISLMKFDILSAKNKAI